MPGAPDAPQTTSNFYNNFTSTLDMNYSSPFITLLINLLLQFQEHQGISLLQDSVEEFEYFPAFYFATRSRSPSPPSLARFWACLIVFRDRLMSQLHALGCFLALSESILIWSSRLFHIKRLTWVH